MRCQKWYNALRESIGSMRCTWRLLCLQKMQYNFKLRSCLRHKRWNIKKPNLTVNHRDIRNLFENNRHHYALSKQSDVSIQFIGNSSIALKLIFGSTTNNKQVNKPNVSYWNKFQPRYFRLLLHREPWMLSRWVACSFQTSHRLISKQIYFNAAAIHANPAVKQSISHINPDKVSRNSQTNDSNGLSAMGHFEHIRGRHIQKATSKD